MTLGMTSLLTGLDGVKPLGICRDELLFWVCDNARDDIGRGYVLCEVLDGSLPFAGGSNDDEGDMLVFVNDDIGGPRHFSTEPHLHQLWLRTPKETALNLTFAELGLLGATLLVPEPYPPKTFTAQTPSILESPTPQTITFNIDNPRRIKSLLLSRKVDSATDAAVQMLRLCAVQGFIVAVTEY